MTRFQHEFTFTVPLTGSVDTVFKALTDPAALERWFAEHVDIDAREGGAFRFWGRHTYGQPSAEDANQTLVSYEPPTSLAFTWHLLGRDSTVTWTLAEAEEGNGAQTMITVVHDFDSAPDINRVTEFVDDLWRIHTGSLCFYLNGEEDVFRPDYSDNSPGVRCEMLIHAPRDKVFAALIVPEHIKNWFPAPAPVVDQRVGGDYGFGFSFEKVCETISPTPMKLLEFVENEKLTITWPDWRGDASVPDQRVTWLLEDRDGKTHLTLLHDGFTRTVDVSDYPFGWQEFMVKIREVAESIA